MLTLFDVVLHCLTALVVPWSKHITRVVVADDLLLGIPRSPATRRQWAFTSARAHMYKAFTDDMGVRTRNIQHVKRSSMLGVALKRPNCIRFSTTLVTVPDSV